MDTLNWSTFLGVVFAFLAMAGLITPLRILLMVMLVVIGIFALLSLLGGSRGR